MAVAKNPQRQIRNIPIPQASRFNTMIFLYPAFLWGLLGISVPVVIHLFNFRRTKKVAFTNVAFLRSVQVSTNAFRKLKNLLVLLARVLFVACLVLVFAQPFLSRNEQAVPETGGITGLYLDNSLSMQQTSGNQRYLDVAVVQAEQLLGSMPANTRFQLLTNDFESNEQFLASKDKLRDRISELGFSNTYRPAEAIRRRQLNLLRKYGQPAGNRFFWISDFQKSTTGDLTKMPLDSANRYFFVPVQTSETRNMYVDSVWLNVPFVREMEANVLNVRIFNAGKDRLENSPVKLFIDNRQVSTAAVSLDGKSQTIASFNFTIQDKGYKKSRIQLDDEPVTFDNAYFFVLNAAPVVQVVHLYGQPDHKFVENVFSGNSLFNAKNLNASATDPSAINAADLVILDEVSSISGVLAVALQEFVRKGGSVAVFPAGNFDENSYQTLLGNLGVRALQKVVAPKQEASVNTLAVPEAGNPFFTSIFEEAVQKSAVNMPTAQAVLNWGNGGTSLLKYKNGLPFLSYFQAGRGRVYVSASPLNPAFSNFARHALFVPVMYKMAALSKAQEQMAYSFGSQQVSVETEARENGGNNQVFHLRKDKFDLIPQQQFIDKELIFELPQASQTTDNQVPEAGYYELTLDGKVQKLLAFNYDKKESQTAFYSPAELKSIFGKNKNVQVYESATEKDFVNDFKEKNIGLNLWKYFLIAGLVFLLIEVLLIRFL